MGKYTAVAKDILNTLQTEAGVLLSKFDPTTGTIEDTDILGATTGGFQFTDTPTITDFGEDIDNVPGQLKQLQRITQRTVTLSSTFASMSEKAVKFVLGACDATDISGANPDKKSTGVMLSFSSSSTPLNAHTIFNVDSLCSFNAFFAASIALPAFISPIKLLSFAISCIGSIILQRKSQAASPLKSVILFTVCYFPFFDIYFIRHCFHV